MRLALSPRHAVRLNAMNLNAGHPGKVMRTETVQMCWLCVQFCLVLLAPVHRYALLDSCAI